MRQGRREGYTNDWAALAAELQSEASSQATRQPTHRIQNSDDWSTGAAEQQSLASSQATQWSAHQIQTPSRRGIGTPPGEQDSQNDLQDTDLSFDFRQTPSAAQVITFFGSDTPSGDDSRVVTRGLSLNRTMSGIPS